MSGPDFNAIVERLDRISGEAGSYFEVCLRNTADKELIGMWRVSGSFAKTLISMDCALGQEPTPETGDLFE